MLAWLPITSALTWISIFSVATSSVVFGESLDNPKKNVETEREASRFYETPPIQKVNGLKYHQAVTLGVPLAVLHFNRGEPGNSATAHRTKAHEKTIEKTE